MKVEVAEARSEVMAPLSAASMESYTRAYPYLVKLHMLQASSSLLHMIKTPGTNLVASHSSTAPPPPPGARTAVLVCTQDSKEEQRRAAHACPGTHDVKSW